MIEITPARPTHVGPLAKRMRDIDKTECKAFGHSPKDALRHGLLYGDAWSALIDGQVEAMFGVVSVDMVQSRGRVWLLMTDKAVSQKRALMRLGARYTEAFHRHFGILQNDVHADNVRAIRWLTRLGYYVGPVDVINGQPMRSFIRCAAQQPFPPLQ
jgi:hypothetical protein